MNSRSLTLLRAPLIAFCLSALAPTHLSAHPGLHDQIAMLDGKISKEESFRLYAQRAHLYYENGDYAHALEDLKSAEKLGPREPLLYQYGSVYLQQGETEKALAFFDEALIYIKDLPQLYQSRAQALKKLGRQAEAVADLKTSFTLQKHPNPGWFIEAADMLLGDSSDNADAALDILDAGMKQIGGYGQLQEKAIAIEVGREHYAAALERMETLGQERQFNPYWRVELASVLTQASQPEEAAIELTKARDFLARSKSTPASRKLEARISELEQQLAHQ